MSGQETTRTGARGRTRKAILDAAMSLLSDNPAAPLADVASAAGVGRSTLHRHFTERTDLIKALAVHVHALSSAAIEAAEPTCGPPIPALRRVVEGQFDLGPVVAYMYNEPTVLSDPALMAHLDTGDDSLIEVLARASEAPVSTPPGWPRRVFWALLQAGYEAAKQDRTPRVQVIDAIMTSLTTGTVVTRPSAQIHRTVQE